MNKEYKQYLIASAKYEIHQLKESGEKFIIDKSTLDLVKEDKCFYGQNFGKFDSAEAILFKKDNNISIGFEENKKCIYADTTALEVLLYHKWENNQKEECIQILSEFCTFKENEEQKDLDKLLNF